ncbi:MAG: dihydroneopterin aldolase [Actinobacteria bacterium]|nr:dihydroneopterin aldolase [Actinomycetota bacterium]
MTGERVELRGLRVLGRCGAELAERTVPQPLEIDLDVAADLAAAATSDELADTVDYGAVCDTVARVAAADAVALLEHLAEAVAQAVLAADERIEGVVVTVRKLRPPVPHDLASAGVRMVRSRTGP